MAVRDSFLVILILLKRGRFVANIKIPSFVDAKVLIYCIYEFASGCHNHVIITSVNRIKFGQFMKWTSKISFSTKIVFRKR